MKSALLFLVAIAFGAMSYHFYRKKEELKKYEFENRTSGGVVGFENYEDSKRHARLMWWYSMRLKGSLTGCAVFLLFALTA